MKYEKGTTLISNEQIIAKKKPLPQCKCGVYFLIHENKIVYVGKTNSLSTRLITHQREKKKIFDSYTFIPIKDEWQRTLSEGLYIYTLKPKYNSTQCLGKKVRDATLNILPLSLLFFE